MARTMPRLGSASWRMHLPRYSIIARWLLRDACWPAMSSVISSLQRPCGRFFADLPLAIADTLELSSRLEFTLNDLGYEFPRYPVPEGESVISFLRERTRQGMRSRYGRADAELKKRARRQIDGVELDRTFEACRVFSDRLGPGALLPRTEHSGTGPRIGCQ